MTNTQTTPLLNTEETYKSLQPFGNIEELNANTTEIRARFADQMTPSTYAVLDVLHRYASKYYGVSFRSKSKIALELGISRRTVIRACKTLEKLEVIEQYELKRHNGDRRQSSNAIVFVSVIEEEAKVDEINEVTPECHSVDAPFNAQKDLSTTYVTCACRNKNKVVKESKVKYEVKTEVAEPKSNAKDLLKESLPNGWFEQASPYAADYNDLYRITGELFKAKVNTVVRIETHVEEFGAVLRSAWVKLKNGRINPEKWYAYLFAAFRGKAERLEHEEKMNPIMNGIRALLDGHPVD